MITKKQIETNIPVLDLIYGDLKNCLYETQQIMEDLPEDSIQYREFNAMFDAYAYLYDEIDRVLHERARYESRGTL